MVAVAVVCVTPGQEKHGFCVGMVHASTATLGAPATHHSVPVHLWRRLLTSRRAVQLPRHIRKHFGAHHITVIFLLGFNGEPQLALHLCYQPAADGIGR